jgi:DNA repair protein RecO (recombination protein O)
VSTEKSIAVVVRVVDFSETSKVVTLYTRDFGKITGLAKGAYRRNGPFDSALDLLSIVRVVFIHKTHDAMDLLTESKLERRFKSASTDLDRLHCAFYLAELLSALTGEADANPQLYDAAESTLIKIDSTSESPHFLLASFECQMLEMVGHGPMLDTCVGCGESLAPDQRQFFGTLAGGLYCSTCRVGKKSVITLSPNAWQLLDSLKANGPVDKQIAENVEPYRVGPRIPAGLGEVREVLNHFVSHLLGSRPRLQNFLRVPSGNI